MSRSNYDKPFYVDAGTSIVAIRCASNHDVLVRYDHVYHPHTLELTEDICERMNREVEIGRPRRNCDVGTAEEQARRFNDYCHKQGNSCSIGRSKGACPMFKGYKVDCAIVWSQMPYLEGGAK